MMSEQKKYLEMMIQSLEKKINILNSLVLLNTEQSAIIQEQEMNLDTFSRNVEQKAEAIEQLNRLDEGFEAVYDRIKAELLHHKDSYKNEIAIMKKLISEITDRSMCIQAAEQRNKQDIEKHFSLLHKNVKESKVSSSAAASYYKSMSNSHVVEPRNIDIRSNK